MNGSWIERDVRKNSLFDPSLGCSQTSFNFAGWSLHQCELWCRKEQAMLWKPHEKDVFGNMPPSAAYSLACRERCL